MITEQTRNVVWKNMLEIERFVRYYGELSDQHLWKHKTLRFFLLIAATGAIAPLLGLVPESYRDMIQVVANVAVAVLVVWDFNADYAKKAAVLQEIKGECSALETEWGILWNSIEAFGIQDEKAREKNAELDRKVSEVTRKADSASVRENRRLNKRCTEAADKVTEERYAV